jgi:DNA-binding MarR family transcriptional regulator
MADHDRFARTLISVARGLGRIARERARDGDITPQQSETLQLLAERGTVSTSTLATLLGIDPSTASRNISGLERAGYVTRQKGSDDGRQTDVRLTARGRRASQSIGSSATSALGALLDKIPRSERSRVVESLDVLVRALDSAPADAAPKRR